MNNLYNPYILTSIAIFIFSLGYIYYRVSKITRLKQLKHLGFRIIKEPRNKHKKQLQKIAPYFMESEILAIGQYATNDGLLLWWLATKKINANKIYVWCYRKAEYTRKFFSRESPEENWYQGIYINNLTQPTIDRLYKASFNYLHDTINLSQENDSLLIIYKRSYVSFSKTLTLLNIIINILNNSHTGAEQNKSLNLAGAKNAPPS